MCPQRLSGGMCVEAVLGHGESREEQQGSRLAVSFFSDHLSLRPRQAGQQEGTQSGPRRTSGWSQALIHPATIIQALGEFLLLGSQDQGLSPGSHLKLGGSRASLPGGESSSTPSPPPSLPPAGLSSTPRRSPPTSAAPTAGFAFSTLAKQVLRAPSATGPQILPGWGDSSILHSQLS